MAVFFMALGPIGMILAASMLQDVATGGENFMTQLFEKVMESLPSPLNIMASLAIVFAMVMVGGPLVGLQVMFENKVFENILIELGVDENTAGYVSMGVQMVIEITIMIIITILTFGAAGAAMGAMITARVAEMAARALTAVAKVLVKVAQAMQKVGGIASKIAKVVMKLAQKLQKMAAKLAKFSQKLGSASKRLSETTKEIKHYKTALKEATKGSDEAAEITNHLKSLKALKGSIRSEIKKTMNIVRNFITVTEVIKMVTDVTTKGIQAGLSFMQADLARSQAGFDAEIEMLENMIKILQKILAKLFQAMESQGSWMVELGNLQNKIWSDASQTATAVAGANEA